jgi:hypothetical protein
MGLLNIYWLWCGRPKCRGFWWGCKDYCDDISIGCVNSKVGPRKASYRASYRSATYVRQMQFINKRAQRRQYCSRRAAAGAVMRKLHIFWLARIGGGLSAVGGKIVVLTGARVICNQLTIILKLAPIYLRLLFNFFLLKL